MAKFQCDQTEDDQVYLTVDDRYSLTIIRTDEGIIVDVWPIENGEYWDTPFTSVKVLDSDVAIMCGPAD